MNTWPVAVTVRRHYRLLGCDTMLQTFRRNVLPPSSKYYFFTYCKIWDPSSPLTYEQSDLHPGGWMRLGRVWRRSYIAWNLSSSVHVPQIVLNKARGKLCLVIVEIIIRKFWIVTTPRAIPSWVQIAADATEIIFYKRFRSALGPIQMGTGVV